ncbi:MAG TPA: phosphoribosylaminoimidazolesuccinocarboxamide synthase [Candidatus Methylacidiphilales bacterium]
MTGPDPLLLDQYGIERLRSGKVRDLYAWRDELWIVASDRLSAFDVILPSPIPDKGRLLTRLSRHWFELLADVVPNHVLSYDLPEGVVLPEWEGRLVRARRCRVIPVECIARGYVSGSGWKEYQARGTVGGHAVPAGLRESDQLPEPLFTPSTKAEAGHDENIDEAAARGILGDARYEQLKGLTLSLYTKAAAYAAERGIIIADTKFEFGLTPADEVILIDEALTPDSSRFWPADQYRPGGPQPSFDKQYVRDYLETLDWDKRPPGPFLPQEVIDGTVAKYREALERLTR